MIEHRFSVRYTTNGISTETKIDALNQRDAYCKLYFSLAKIGYEYEQIKVERMFRLY